MTDARDTIKDLVERFNTNIDSYRSGAYNEAQVRREFIDPMFRALGWDVDNERGWAEAYKEVIHEDAIKVGGATKAPDYCFRIGGTRKFFLEAKKPSVSVGSDPLAAYQLRRYAWSAKLPLSILTDFEEFAVYDCRTRPVQTDKSSMGRTLYLKYTDYIGRWDEIASVFSRDAVLKGSFDRYAESTGRKRDTAEVDTSFLAEIESWRDLLAKNMALRNRELGVRELNQAVQRTIDRLVFLRICEDRGIENYGRLQALLNATDVYPRLGQLFVQADERFNSGLFHFRGEPGRENHDAWTLDLAIDDKVVKDIIKKLYYPESPYEFSVLPVEILGQIYERFLGKVIRLTAGDQAKVEEKPEVRKAGGVYYTPTYIVDYIVKNTVGKLCEGSTPRQVAELRILDPACGSGSFLLGVYQFLLDWHLKWYLEHEPERHAKGKSPALFQGQAGWQLTSSERKRILLGNIFGVDIDQQAVEVTKLSLLLKVLEGQTSETLNQSLKLFHERALPDLANNIKCGNSLIGPDFYEGKQASMFDQEEVYRINAFDWSKEFPEIMGRGGFDAVIGNPPYVRIQRMKEWAPLEVEAYKERYSTARTGNYDIYVVFAEKGLNLMSSRGRLGFILPNKFLSTDYGSGLRKILADRKAVTGLVDFSHGQVFDNATTYTCLLFLTSSGSDHVHYRKITTPRDLPGVDDSFDVFETSKLDERPWRFGCSADTLLWEKLSDRSEPLIHLPSTIARGSSTGCDPVFVLNGSESGLTTQDSQVVEIEEEILRIPIHATDFRHYSFVAGMDKRIIFPYEVVHGGYHLLEGKTMKEHFPKAWEYLTSRKDRVAKRKQSRTWFAFSAPRSLHVHDNAQILVPLLADKALYCRAPKDSSRYCLMASGGFSITVDQSSALNPEYVLGVLNSHLLFWCLRSISNIFRAGWVTCTKQYVGKLPIRTIDFSSPADKSRHDRMVELVERMLDMHKGLSEVRTEHDKDVLRRQIAATDAEIDRLVYELYGLTEAEIKIVEGGCT